MSTLSLADTQPGGGAGGLLLQSSLTLVPGFLYSVSVGAGGAGAPAQASSNAPGGSQGQPSSFGPFTAVGGGGGGGWPAGSGGSGGGAWSLLQLPF